MKKLMTCALALSFFATIGCSDNKPAEKKKDTPAPVADPAKKDEAKK